MFRKVKENDGIVRDIIEDEYLFEIIDEDIIILATTSATLSQANILNITLLNGKVTEIELAKKKIQDEIISLKIEVKKRKKVDDHLILLRESILVEQELLHDSKVECFAEVRKMEDIIKALEKHLENASQVYQNMESLQKNIEELDEWRNMEKNVSSGLPIIKSYDIRLHTLATNECQELASKFEENVH